MDFKELEDLRRALEEIRLLQTKGLAHYHDATTNGFRHKFDDRRAGHYSMASTATCVLSLEATREWASGPWAGDGLPLATLLLNREWKSAGLRKNNSFTVAFILEAALALLDPNGEVNLEPSAAARLQQAENILRKAIQKGFVALEPYPPSAYLTQLVIRVLRRRGPLGEKLVDKVFDWAQHELNRQIALLTAKSKTADVFQLAYAVMLMAMLKDTGAWKPDDGLIVQAGLDLLFAAQQEDGSWPRSRPLFHYPDVGDAHCYEYEMLVQLLSQVPLQDKLLRYLPQLTKAAAVLPETKLNLESGGWGWSSGHHPQISGPESWSTASVYHFAHVLDRLVAEGIRRAIFKYFDQTYIQPRTDPQEIQLGCFAPSLLDCPVYANGNAPFTSLRATLYEYFVKPVATEATKVSSGGSLSKQTPMSAIFFGPPGTSKTELSRSIAEFLGWPLLALDPSHFVRQGLDRVQSEADVVFRMLEASAQLVVLLDEFDEMVRDRQNSQSELLSRFLTTAMLPKLAAINKRRRIVFIVATNHIEQFDIAISRHGRFDLILQVLPPTVDEKLKYRVSSTGTESLEEYLRAKKIDIDPEIKQRLELLTFGEFQILLAEISRVSDTQQIMTIINNAEKNCMMKSKLEPDGKETWETASKEQRTKVRLPAPV